MRSLNTLLLSLFVAMSSGAPLLKIREEKNSSLPSIKIFGTGGTIASKGSTSATTAGYSVGLTVNDLIEAVPSLAEKANLDYLQVSNVGSNSLNYTHLIPLYHGYLRGTRPLMTTLVRLSRQRPTLWRRQLFFLDLTIIQRSQYVSQALRPATATSADGPMNLYQAVSIAASEKSLGRGTMITLNDRIASGDDVEFYYPPVKPNGWQFLTFPTSQTLRKFPEVIILYSYQGLNPELIVKAVKDLGAKGIVLAGSGAGSWTATGSIVNEQLYEEYGIPIVHSRRTADGTVPPDDAPEYAIGSGYLNPQKSRILLQLCLYSGYGMDQIRSVFSGVYGG
ncbi:CBM_collapsed_G0039230.mRNA.1.CDS.1 [Saccharomyces cerevisiae]|nr:CBM_collapsed_G0039230.mRNA.1.CDS.1 [Saccharomyces cerevisiae]